MRLDVAAWVDDLRSGDDERRRVAFAELVRAAREDVDVVDDLAALLEEEWRAGAVTTPRLLTVLGTRRDAGDRAVAAAEAVLRAPADAGAWDAVLAAGAVVARSRPGRLLPAPSTIATLDDAGRAVARSAFVLLTVSAQVLAEEAGGGLLPSMIGWLWADAARHDLMTLADLVGVWIGEVGAGDPLVATVVRLLATLVTHVEAGGDPARYALEVLVQADVPQELLHELALAAIVASACDHVRRAPAGPCPDPEAPLPDPIVDRLLVAFADGGPLAVEMARAELDALASSHPVPGLMWWLAATVDDLPDHRRTEEVGWVLPVLRVEGGSTPPPARLVRRWLDTPLLLDGIAVAHALTLLARRCPELVASDYLARAVRASLDRHPALLVGELWARVGRVLPETVHDVLEACRDAGLAGDDLVAVLADATAGTA